MNMKEKKTYETPSMEATAVVLEGIVCVSNDEPTVEASRNGYTYESSEAW